MSVLLFMKMDLGVEKDNFDEVIENAFDESGVKRMLGLPTLQWKIWGTDPVKREGCGCYLFADRKAAEVYAAQAVSMLGSREGVTNVTAQIWTISEEQTRITKGPIDLPMISELQASV
ncbi:MAG: YdhR family protein [Firmicutes bacterium]|jgi:hypothetical protein|nr:YdhR family protein [Bacillota bacterium]NBI62315.1 hypothetical protein [Clostridiales bacterium]